MTKGARAAVAGILGFIAFRITTEIMAFGAAVAIGVAVIIAVWLLTSGLTKADPDRRR